MSQVATPEIKQPKKRGRPRKYLEGCKSEYFRTPSSATVKEKTSSDTPAANLSERTSKYQDWHNKSVEDKKRHYRFTRALKTFVSSCTAISAETWESFRLDHRNSCGLCGALFEGTEVLREHILKHVFLKCLLCSTYFNELESFKSHVQHHSSTKFNGGVLPCSSAVQNQSNLEEFKSGSDEKIESNQEQFNSAQDEEDSDPFGIRKAMEDASLAVNCTPPNVSGGRSMPELDFSEEEVITEECSNSWFENALDEVEVIHCAEKPTEIQNLKRNDCIVPDLINPVPLFVCSDEMQLTENTLKNDSSEGPDCLIPKINSPPNSGTLERSKCVNVVSEHDCSLDNDAKIGTSAMAIGEKCPSPTLVSSIRVGSAELPCDHSYSKLSKEVVPKKDQEIIEIDSEPECSITDWQRPSSNVETIICDDDSDSSVVFVAGPFKMPKPLKPMVFESNSKIDEERFFGNLFHNKSSGAAHIKMPRFPAPINHNVSHPISLLDDEHETPKVPAGVNWNVSQPISLLDDEHETLTVPAANNQNANQPMSSLDMDIELTTFPTANNQIVDQAISVSDDEHETSRVAAANNQSASQPMSPSDMDIEIPIFPAASNQIVSQPISLLDEHETSRVPAANNQDASQPMSPSDKDNEIPTFPATSNQIVSQPISLLDEHETPTVPAANNQDASQPMSSSDMDIEIPTFPDVNNQIVGQTRSSLDEGTETMVLDVREEVDQVDVEQVSLEPKRKKVRCPPRSVKNKRVPETTSNELSLYKRSAKGRKNNAKCKSEASTVKYSNKSRRQRVSRYELESLFLDIPKSSVVVEPETPSPNKRVTRRSVSSGTRSNVRKTVSGTAKEPVSRSHKKKKNSNCSEVGFLTRLYVEKSGNVPKAASIKIEMLENQANRCNKKKSPSVPGTIISGKDFKSFSWVVPTTSSSSKYRANDKQWKKLVDNAKASESLLQISESESDNDNNQRLQSVTNDAYQTQTEPDGMEFESSLRLSESESDNDDNLRLQSVTNDVSKTQTEPEEMEPESSLRLSESESGHGESKKLQGDVFYNQTESYEIEFGISEGLPNFEVVDVRNLGECTSELYANDSLTSKDPLALGLDDPLQLDGVLDVGDTSHKFPAPPRIVQPSDAKVKFDEEKFISRMASASTISMDDVPELVEGQWLVKYVVFHRLNEKVDRIMPFPEKKSYFVGFEDDREGLNEKIPEDKIIEECTYFCDYRDGNHITIPVRCSRLDQQSVSDSMTEAGSFTEPNPTSDINSVQKSGNTTQNQGNDVTSVLNPTAVGNDRIVGSCENPDDAPRSVELENFSKDEKWKELMQVEISSNEVLDNFEDVSETNDDGGKSPTLSDGILKKLSPTRSDSHFKKVPGSSQVSPKSDLGLEFLTKNLNNSLEKTTTDWGFIDSENGEDLTTVNSSKSPGKDTIEDDCRFTDKTELFNNETTVSKGIESMNSSETPRWNQLDNILRKIDGLPIKRKSLPSTSTKPPGKSSTSLPVSVDLETPTDSMGCNIEHTPHLPRDSVAQVRHSSTTCPCKMKGAFQKPVPQPSCSSSSNDFNSTTGILDDQFISNEGGNRASFHSQTHPDHLYHHHHTCKNTSRMMNDDENDENERRSEVSSRSRWYGKHGLKKKKFGHFDGCDPHFSNAGTNNLRLHDDLLERLDQDDCSEDEDDFSDPMYCHTGSGSSSGSLSPDSMDDIILQSGHSSDGPLRGGDDSSEYSDCMSPMVHGSPSSSPSSSSDCFDPSRSISPFPFRRTMHHHSEEDYSPSLSPPSDQSFDGSFSPFYGGY